MPTNFFTIQKAKDYALRYCGADPKTTRLEEVSTRRIMGTQASHLLNDPDMPPEIKATIHSEIKAQKGFKFQGRYGEIKFVIGPRDEVFQCWLLPNPDNGPVIEL